MVHATHASHLELSKNSEQGPLVSILMATYNRRDRLIKAIESVRAQSYPHWELCLVCDGGKPVDDIVKKYNDPRIIFQHNSQNKGYGYTANTAFSLSKGAYIAYLGDDDVWMPDHLECLMTALLRQKEAGFAYANSLCIRRRKTEDGSFTVIDEYIPYQGHKNLADLLEFNHITGISVLHERALFEKVGGFDEKLLCIIDFDLLRRMLCFSNTVYVDKVTSCYYEDLECASDHLTNLATKDPLRYKMQQLRIYGKKLPNAMEERFKHSLAYLRHKHHFIYAAASKSLAQEQGDFATAQKFSKILAKNPYPIPTGNNMDLAAFLMQDGETEAALRLFKQHLATSKSGVDMYFTVLECAISCEDVWAYEIFQALEQNKDRLQTSEKKRLESLALDLKRRVKATAKNT